MCVCVWDRGISGGQSSLHTDCRQGHSPEGHEPAPAQPETGSGSGSGAKTWATVQPESGARPWTQTRTRTWTRTRSWSWSAVSDPTFTETGSNWTGLDLDQEQRSHRLKNPLAPFNSVKTCLSIGLKLNCSDSDSGYCYYISHDASVRSAAVRHTPEQGLTGELKWDSTAAASQSACLVWFLKYNFIGKKGSVQQTFNMK